MSLGERPQQVLVDHQRMFCRGYAVKPAARSWWERPVAEVDERGKGEVQTPNWFAETRERDFRRVRHCPPLLLLLLPFPPSDLPDSSSSRLATACGSPF